jgi:hypothetical protein
MADAVELQSRYDEMLPRALDCMNRATVPRPVHPIKDFTMRPILFRHWLRQTRREQRHFADMRLIEARLLFAEFSMDFNQRNLSFDYYRQCPEAEWTRSCDDLALLVGSNEPHKIGMEAQRVALCTYSTPWDALYVVAIEKVMPPRFDV